MPAWKPTGRRAEVARFDTITLGGGIHASGIQGLSFLAKNMHLFKHKRIRVFCVGASPYEETAFQAIVARNMKGALQGVPLFYCRGAWDLQSMTLVDRAMCQLLRKTLQNRPPEKREPWMNALLEAGDTACDWTDRAYLAPLKNSL